MYYFTANLWYFNRFLLSMRHFLIAPNEKQKMKVKNSCLFGTFMAEVMEIILNYLLWRHDSDKHSFFLQISNTRAKNRI